MSLEVIIANYSAAKAAERANYDISAEEKAAYANELAMAQQGFDLLIEGRRHVGPSRGCRAHGEEGPTERFYRCMFEAVGMGNYSVDNSVRPIAVEPSQELFAHEDGYKRKMSLDVHVYGGEDLSKRRMHMHDCRMLGSLAVDTADGATESNLDNVRHFRRLLDEVLAKASEAAPMLIGSEELPLSGL